MTLTDENKIIELKVSNHFEEPQYPEYNLDQLIFDLDGQLDLLTSNADNFDILISVGSGLICSLADILWVGDFSLDGGRNIASDQVDSFVFKTAEMLGYEGDSLEGAVRFLEKKFPIPSDGNTPDFGGGLQHHLRDFAHHPTIVGLMFSMLTQFTYKSYGTDVNGNFIVVNVPERSIGFIGEDIPTKILYGTITWFFHLVSDMAGSSSSASKSGGTGIPGPILSLAKEISVLPIFKDVTIGENEISVFLSKLFNGTLLAKYDSNGKIIKDSVMKFDLRSEMGVALELGRQALPVIANECIVRSFYFIRHFAKELKYNNIKSFKEIKTINWNNVKPYNNPTISRMLLVSISVFTGVDIAEAIVSQKYWVAINYVGVGRFVVAVGSDVSWGLKRRNIKQVQNVYKDIKQAIYLKEDDNLYSRIGVDMKEEKLGLSLEQTEILYNLEYYKVKNDIENTKSIINNEAITNLKMEWLEEWKEYITSGFSNFLQIDNVTMEWYSENELIKIIEENSPEKPWFRLVLLESMLFEPYFPLGLQKDKKGKDIPSKKHSKLNNPLNAFSTKKGDHYLDSLFVGDYYTKDYIYRLRKCYNKVTLEMKEVIKGILIGTAVTAGIAIATIATAGAFAPAIAVALVGSNFAGLSGAALTSACLAYLGGGAIAIGGAGMAGGTIAIVGGGAILGVGAGLSVGGSVGSISTLGKQHTIAQSAKLLVSVREIFLNDEHDLEYSNTVYEQYLENIMDIEKGLVELKLKADVASGAEKKELKATIKNAEDSVDAMKIARKNLLKFKSSFETGLENTK